MREDLLSQVIIQKHFKEIYAKADKIVSYFIVSFFVFGIFIAPIYDTWAYALGLGGGCILAYVVCFLLIPGTLASRMVISLIFSAYMLQFIGQMHGMAEMHFVFFINIAILIIYQDWRIMVPYVLAAVIHHSFFFYLQLQGYSDVGIYFIDYTEVNWMVLGFHYAWVVLMAVVCGWWAIILHQRTLTNLHDKILRDRQAEVIQKSIQFAETISQGNLEADFEAFNEEDILGKSLLNMRENLRNARQKEEIERFTSIGLAEISHLLRDNQYDLVKMTNQVLAKLISYLGVQQGGIFIENNTDEVEAYLEMIACYAYDRSKIIQKRILMGEGLIGQAYISGKQVYLRDLPEDYAKISSGLGETKPKCLLIIPLQFNEARIGVLEIASFHEIPTYQIDFVEKIAESIASTIKSIQVNQSIQKLLTLSQEKTERLNAQEEEMRQREEI